VPCDAIRLAAESGLVGCSIEDASGNPDAPIFEIGHATERIAAAAAAARALPFPFTLTGRTENFLRGRLDLEDTTCHHEVEGLTDRCADRTDHFQIGQTWRH
jgi:2-methylisocitrate lyase-like PEP mutase family enzyme